ncbi:MAG: branched-chain amino acid ABC transporter permease [Candidatus Nezhaarchaeales archaeon]
MILQILICLIASSTYAILASGFSLLYSVGRMLNLAYTVYYMLGAFLLYWLRVDVGLPILPAVILSILLVTIIGTAIQYLIQQITGHELIMLVLTFIIGAIIASVISHFITTGVLYLIIPSVIEGTVPVMDVHIPLQYFLTLSAVLFVIILFWIIQFRTPLGTTLRAVAQDSEMAVLLGINPHRVKLYANVIAVFLAGVAGVVVAPMYPWSSTMWLHPLLVLLAIAIMGGLGSFYGCIIASFIIGFAENIVVFLIPGAAYLKDVVPMLLALLILLVRPQGLRGVKI